MSALLWLQANQDGPVHAWRDDQPTTVVWISLCCAYAERGDLQPSEDTKCVSCALMHGAELADQHGDPKWR